MQSGDSDSEEEEEYREPAVKLPKVRAGKRSLAAAAAARRKTVAFFNGFSTLMMSWSSVGIITSLGVPIFCSLE